MSDCVRARVSVCASSTCPVTFTDCKVPADHVLGEVGPPLSLSLLIVIPLLPLSWPSYSLANFIPSGWPSSPLSLPPFQDPIPFSLGLLVLPGPRGHLPLLFRHSQVEKYFVLMMQLLLWGLQLQAQHLAISGFLIHLREYCNHQTHYQS